MLWRRKHKVWDLCRSWSKPARDSRSKILQKQITERFSFLCFHRFTWIAIFRTENGYRPRDLHSNIVCKKKCQFNQQEKPSKLEYGYSSVRVDKKILQITFMMR